MATRTHRSRRRRKSGILKYIFPPIIVSVIIFAGLQFSACDKDPERNYSLPDSSNLEKVITNKNLEEELIEYTGMTVSFNAGMHIPNWVSWELTREEINGQYPRERYFAVDPNVKGCADPRDYSYSGYDRGHMAPAGDMKWDRKAMQESFLMTNVCPQNNELNSGSWNRLEEKCRVWARHDSAIIIVTGPVLTDRLEERIGQSGVVVPQRFFKVILAPHATPPRGIGFIMNNGRVQGGMQAAAVSIDEVEEVTGHDFFSALPDSLEDEIESQCNFHYWSTLK